MNLAYLGNVQWDTCEKRSSGVFASCCEVMQVDLERESSWKENPEKIPLMVQNLGKGATASAGTTENSPGTLLLLICGSKGYNLRGTRKREE